MMQRIKDGAGVESPYGPHLWLDLRHLGRRHLETKLREVSDICRDFLGIDPAADLIPVRPTQHYSMGGVRVNKDGQAYGLRGLFAVGEAACWDLHGFNRLGGNSLAETVVAGRVVGRRVAAFAARESLSVEAALAGSFAADAAKRIDGWLGRRGDGPSVFALRDAMAETMVKKVGVFRTGAELEQAVAELGSLRSALDRAVLRAPAPGASPELTFALRLEGMLRLALLTALGALERTESRGAHCRTDHAARDDARWLVRTLARWPEGSAEPKLEYEPVGLLDLPPGDRGYGQSERLPMAGSLEDYNARVADAWRAAGALPTEEPLGARMRWGAWRGTPPRETPDRSE
jgi:fumarate reductase flavoprotein subunit